MKAVPEWLAKLTLICMIGLVFETVTGLLIYFAPFNEFNQYGVLLHTFVGVAWLFVFLWYSIRHWLKRYRGGFNTIQILGYASFAVILACALTGVWLTAEAVFGTRISYAISDVHLYTGFALVAALGVHLALTWNRHTDAAPQTVKYRFATATVLGTVVLLAVQAVIPVMTPQPTAANEFPADYLLPYGDNPFAPSLGHTESNGAYDSWTLSGSEGCGSSGCHEQILAEWAPSSHRYSSADLAFQTVQDLMLKDVGAEATRYCAGCHDPIALFSGSKSHTVEGLTSVGAEEGVSCVVCHAITQTDVRGNADYTISQPARYVGEYKDDAVSKWVSDFLIRAYPQQHVTSFERPLYKTAEYCAACHKQFIDEEVNQIGWVQLQNQYDNWMESRWHHENDPTKTITCRECHMPLVASSDPAAGDGDDYNRDEGDGKHRSHRFLAANQVMPLLLKLPGAEEHVRLTEQWLRGEIQVPEIAEKWMGGPVITLGLNAPEAVKPGEMVNVGLVLTNNKTGHGFPTGPLDIIRSWVEFTVRDDQGNVVYETGKPDENGMMSPDAVIFKAEGIDQYGEDIDRHNLWEMVGARFKRTLFPGMQDTASYAFFCPQMTGATPDGVGPDTTELAFGAPAISGNLEVTAELLYQKADAAFMDRLFGAEANLRTPATVISSDTVIIRILADSSEGAEADEDTVSAAGL